MNYLNQSPDERLETYQNQIKNQTALTDSNEDTSIIYQPVRIEDQKVATYQNYNGNAAFTSSIMNSPIIAKTEQKETKKPELNEENPNEAQTYIDRIGRNYNESRSRLAQINTITPNSDYNTDLSVREIGPAGFEALRKRLGASESNQNYGELNINTHEKKKNAGSGAWGKYQFIWGAKPGQGQRDQIAKVTGITTPEAFLKNPQAQEKYFKWYYDNTLQPELKRFRKQFPDIKWSDNQTMEALHFRGYSGLTNMIKEGRLNATTSINPSVMSRINKFVNDKQLNAKSRMSINENNLAIINKRLGY